MKYAPYVLVALLVALVIYIAASTGISRPDNEFRGEDNVIEPTSGVWETRIDEQPPVIIEVTPLEFGRGAAKWRFSVVFTTHSGSLDEDPSTAAFIVDDVGKIYRPIAWEGAEPGGHHREGVLIFNSIEPTPRYIELKMNNIGSIAERSFRWNIE